MVQSLPPARQIEPDDGNDLLIPLVSGVQELLFAPVNPFNDRPGFVAGPRPDSGLAGAVQDLTRLNCRLWASRDKSGFSPRVNQYNGEVCNPYLDDIGEKPDGGFVGPPFQGGQCPAVYIVSAIRETNLSGQGSITIRALGPIGGVRIRQISGNNYDWELFCSGLAPGFDNCGPVTDTGPGWKRLGGLNSSDGITSTSITGVTPCGLDDCGNPPPVLQPPGTVTPVTPIVPTINIDLPGVGPINVNIDIDVDGNPVISLPDIGAEVTVSPEFGNGGGGGGGGGGAPPFDPEIGEAIDSPAGGGGGGDNTDFGEPPEGRIWIGAFVQLLGSLTPFGKIPGDQAGQSALSTVVGNAALLVNDGSSPQLKSTYTQIRSEWSDHIVGVPGLTVTGIRVRVNPALGYRVYPVSVKDPLAESA